MKTGNDAPAEMPQVKEIFKKIAGEHTEIEFQSLKDESVPAVLTVSEESRRMEDMMKMYAMEAGASFPTEAKLILNADNGLIQKIADTAPSDASRAEMIARQVYGLSLLSQRKLSSDELKDFLNGSYELLALL